MRRHPFDPWSFVLGSLFLGTGIAFLTNSVDLLHTSSARLWPIPVLAIGLLIVFTNVKRARRRSAAGLPGSVEEAATADTEPVAAPSADHQD